MDGKFEKLRDLMKNNGDLKSSLFNTTSAGEHVPEIERRIRVIKERVRAEKSGLPFTYYPTVMVVDLISFAITWLNAFPMSGGIKNILPRSIVVRTNLNYNEHCRCPFGAYIQTHKEGTNNTD